MTARKAVFVDEKWIDKPEISPRDPAAWVYPDELCAMKNGAHYNWGLATLSNEVDVRFVALLSLFDRTQGRVGGRKVG